MIDRFITKITFSSSGCWLWTGTLKGKGYAQTWINRQRWAVHRFAYRFWVGPIPKGFDIDHLCRVRHCVNPDHLRAVDHRTNVLAGNTIAAFQHAKTACLQGHPFDETNTIWYADNTRRCRACKVARDQRYRKERKP